MFKQVRNIYKRFREWMNFNPPGAMTSKGWRLFKEEFKEVAPIRYWIKNDFSKAVVWPLKITFRRTRDWIRYRTTHRYHVLRTGLLPGYCDVDMIMLWTNFTLLEDFVEKELASHCARETSWYERHMPFYRVFFPFRRPDLGLKHLDWASSLDDPSLPAYQRSDDQAKSAREIRELYLWWRNVRPNRQSIKLPTYDKQGKGDLGCFDDDFDTEAEDYKAYEDARTRIQKQHAEWKDEDQHMLERLIRIRQSLWS